MVDGKAVYPDVENFGHFDLYSHDKFEPGFTSNIQ